jgi:hypothetical protein
MNEAMWYVSGALSVFLSEAAVVFVYWDEIKNWRSR